MDIQGGTSAVNKQSAELSGATKSYISLDTESSFTGPLEAPASTVFFLPGLQ